jgi:hypothetical protein
LSGPCRTLRGASQLSEGRDRTVQDRRCRFGLAARIEMVRRREAGESLRSIARSMACSPSTVTTQADRWAQADEAARADFSCLALIASA